MDIQKSLITHIDTLLRADTDLKAAMGGTVRLFPVMAPPDSAFPYLVHRIDMGILGDFSPVARCTYMLDIWSYSPSAEGVLAIRDELMRLLDGRAFTTAETTNCWLWIQTDGFIPDPSQDIWHYGCQFNLRFLKDAQVGLVLRR